MERLREMPDGIIHCAVTSPPYWGLRDYGCNGQIGLEPTPTAFLEKMVAVFREVKRVLRDDGVMFLNLGDSYFGSRQGTMADGSQVGGTKQMTNKGSVTNAGGRRANSYGTSGKEPANSQAHGCLCGNLCDVCRVVYQSRKSRSDGLLVAMLTASLSESSRERMGFPFGHLPTLDLDAQVGRSAAATQDHSPAQDHAGERLRALLASTLGELTPQLLDECLRRDSLGVCLLCAHSLPDLTQAFADTEVCTCDTVGGASACHTTGKDASGSAYLDYTTASLKPKDLCGIPWRLAFALQADGWYLRSDIIWHKPNPMPESVTDRPTKAHEYLFLLTKSPTYFYDQEAVREPVTESTMYRARTDFITNNDVAKRKHFDPKTPSINPRTAEATRQAILDGRGRNLRTVWTIPTQPYPDAHFATYPEKLVEPCIKAGTSVKGCCAACGAPWAREIDVTYRNDTTTDGRPAKGNHRPETNGEKSTFASGERTRRLTTTTGWHSMCTHAADTVPCTVLDIFCGSGTTGEVAMKLGRSFIGIELNPKYCELARNRIGAVQPLFDAVPA